jgi:CO/xanthine dehydrogenase FAD-binding subunit
LASEGQGHFHLVTLSSLRLPTNNQPHFPDAVQTRAIRIQIANILHPSSGDTLFGDWLLYIRPKTLAEAVRVLASEPAQVLSGGTDFYPALGDGPVRASVVDVSRLDELRGITTRASRIRIGGLTTWSEIIRTPLSRCFDALKAAAREVGSVQIQNRGTVAGNLCNASPAADGVPPLLALDAEVELFSQAGTRRMPLAEFICGNRRTQRRADELMTAVWVPRVVENAGSAFVKLGARRYLVISISMVAAVVLVDDAGRVADARIAVGSCSAVARRLHGLEGELIGAAAGRGFSGRVRPEHLQPLSPIDDVRATAEYRMDASLTLVRRALNSCVGAC